MNKNGLKSIKRIFGYILKYYKKTFIIVLICVVISSVASVAGSLFLQTLIDDYITPLLEVDNPVYTGLLKMIGVLAIVYIFGVISSYLYNRLLADVSQGVLKKIRDEMFNNMESFPISYFDTHTHGEIMSRYTNDTDTLRQMISQSLAQVISSGISIIAIIISMLYLSPVLTVFVLIFTAITIYVTQIISKKSSKYYVNQQESLGKVNGYVEEMLNGQKVVKVFTHEKKSKEEFKKINDKLFEDASKANGYSNIMMPIASNLGNLQYVLIAIIGTVASVQGIMALTIGTLISFLQLTRNITQPINQVMNQMSSIIMALAGAGRIFEMMDEEPEQDNRICNFGKC